MGVHMYRVVSVEGRRRMMTVLTYGTLIDRLFATDSTMGDSRSKMNSGAGATWPRFHEAAAREGRGTILPLNT